MARVDLMRFLLLLVLLISSVDPTPLAAADLSNSPVGQARQMVLVTAGNWTTVSGKMRLFEKSEGDWKAVGSWPVVVGRKGLAWGKGMHQTTGDGPIKKEGDGKSPAGIFTLSSSFGTELPQNIKGLKLPYLPLTSLIECVDDAKSTNYNRILDRSKFSSPDWNSSEKMAEYVREYRLGVAVDHNANPRKQGEGSCIFIHIWKDGQTGTAGCTAMQGENMENLLGWLDPQKIPVLVQLPEAEYQSMQKVWALPNLK